MLITVSVVMMLQIWHLGFSHFLLPVDVAGCGSFDFMKMCLRFGGCLYAKIGVTSNGCLEDVNLLYFLNSLTIVFITRMTEG